MINTFELKVTTGITGGFIPAIPSRIVVLNASLPTVAVENYVQSFGGTEKIGMANYVKSSCSLDSPNIDFDQLIALLIALPTEDPPASTDIYGLNIGVSLKSETANWANAANSGCVRGESQTHPSKSEREIFKQVVQTVHAFADQACS